MHSLLNLVDSFLLNLPRPATAPILGLIGWESMKLEDFQVLGDYTKVWEMNQIKDFSKKVVTPSKGIFDFPLFYLKSYMKCAKIMIYFYVNINEVQELHDAIYFMKKVVNEGFIDVKLSFLCNSGHKIPYFWLFSENGE